VVDPMMLASSRLLRPADSIAARSNLVNNIGISLENARSTKNWTGPVQCFTAETDRRFSTGSRLRPSLRLRLRRSH